MTGLEVPTLTNFTEWLFHPTRLTVSHSLYSGVGGSDNRRVGPAQVEVSSSQYLAFLLVSGAGCLAAGFWLNQFFRGCR